MLVYTVALYKAREREGTQLLTNIITNEAYKSVEHRATVNSQKERLSIGMFTFSKLEGDLGPAPSLITLENPAKLSRALW
ncbi:unnamed protein product [Coffea canephora]|uniref:Isopenicillin N synthase-like Fe(2+) 2OG dioxygenase domain-containing protein n=1 Tax=Coffea canephora TaxID=49390 RepID=A0A068V1Z7_COFCA|nr:unnamed protein product [Coffea canephora]